MQRKEEGYNATKIEKRFLKTEEKTISESDKFLKALESSLPKTDFPYGEPSELDKIEVERPKKPGKIEITFSHSELYDKIYGGWLGRCAGCLLGKTVRSIS